MKRSLQTSEIDDAFAHNHHHHCNSFNTMTVGEESHQTTAPHSTQSTDRSLPSQEQEQQQPHRPPSSLYYNSTLPPSSLYHHPSSTSSSSSSLSSTPTTATTNTSTSHLEYQSIQSCFKRVKISTSPGELRLSKDLEDICTTHHWRHHNRDFLSPDSCIKLHQDVVDPLRLSLSVWGKNVVMTYMLQVPRMYPHAPPVVYRVSADPPLQYPSGMPTLEQVRIVPQTTTTPSSPLTKTTRPSNIEIYNQWSPISRLMDLIEFLVELLPKRMRQWEEWLQYPSLPASPSTPLPETMEKKEMKVDVQSRHYQRRSSQLYLSEGMSSGETSGECTKELQMDDDDDEEEEYPMPVNLAAKKHFVWHPNRFHVGYDTSTAHVGMEEEWVGSSGMMEGQMMME